MEKLNMHSSDLVAGNVEKIGELFPTVISESLDGDGKPVMAIDFDLLRQELSGHIIDGPDERYRLDWPGKREAVFAANASIAKTLRPVRKDSVDFDETRNLFIEGDNLDALKLLQESYLGKIKLIYIDPPYNTGNDFVYDDTFAENADDYLLKSGQVDSDGARLVANTEANGRFHSAWLSMMLPRLRLARNLMTDDALIFISIDEVESAALKMMCDEIFGRNNFVEQVAWKNKYNAGALAKGISNVHEYILVYSRQPIASLAAPLNEDQRTEYKKTDDKAERRGGYVTQPLATRSKDPRPNLVYPIMWEGEEIWPDKQWLWSKDRVEQALENDEIVFSRKRDGKVSVRVKQYLRSESGSERLGKPLSVLIGPYNQEGTRDLETLFDTKVFDFPKPVELIKYFASFVVNGNTADDFVFLDFFAGSGSSAEAILRLNAEDGGSRSYVAVQAPELCDPKSVAAKEGFETIADLSRERIRRAGDRILSKAGLMGEGLDVGFRVLKIDSPNMTAVERAAERTEQDQLTLYADVIKNDRTADDLLFQVLVGWGLNLTMPISVEEIEGHVVHIVEDGVLVGCFDDEVSPSLVRNIAELKPLRVVFRDSGFSSDADRINAEQVFAEVSPYTDVKVI